MSAGATLNSAMTAMTAANQVRQLISRSQAILFASLQAELWRAILHCRIAKFTSDDAKRLSYVVVAEQTSAKFMKLRSHGKIVRSKPILNLMACLEEELGGQLYDLDFHPPTGRK